MLLSMRRVVVMATVVAVAAMAVVLVGHQWTRGYADAAPTIVKLSSSDPATLATKTYLIDCSHQPVVRPKSFTLTCADANSYLQRLDWTVWGGATAKASATYVENDCTPNCAAGKFVRYPAKVQADRRARKDGTAYYRSILVVFPGKHPSWVKHGRTRFDVDFGTQS